MDDEALTPVQRRIVNELLDLPHRDSRPTFRPELSAELMDLLEDTLEPVAERLGIGELYVNKGTLARVLSCERHHLAEQRTGFPGWSPRTARGTVTHKAIELSVFAPALEPMELTDAAIESLIADDREFGPGSWLESAGPALTAELRAEVNDAVGKFLECWPPLSAAWRPRTESASRVELCEGRIVLSGKVDLLLGQAIGSVARVLVVDLKTGAPYLRHLDDLRFYALLHTLRTGVPPFRIAGYYLDSSSFHHEDVTEDLLAAAARRVVEGTTRLIQLHLGDRLPTSTPGPTCSWCGDKDDCDGRTGREETD